MWVEREHTVRRGSALVFYPEISRRGVRGRAVIRVVGFRGFRVRDRAEVGVRGVIQGQALGTGGGSSRGAG